MQDSTSSPAYLWTSTLNNSTPVVLRSLSTNTPQDAIRRLRPCNNQILVETTPHVTQFGNLYIVGAEHMDVQISKILSISDKVNIATKERPLQIGDRILSVRVVTKKIDSIEMRSESGSRIGFIPDEHVLAVVTDEAIVPVGDRVLVEAQHDVREYGRILMLGADSLDVHAGKVLAVGPKVVCLEPGEYAIHPRRYGVELDSFELRKKYGSNLKILRERDISGAGDTYVEGQAAAGVEL